MITRTLTTGALAFALLGAGNGRALAQNALVRDQSNRGGQYAGSLDARQHGYEHAYRDGADRGRLDRERNAGYHPQNNESQDQTLGYENYFGNKLQYIEGYREGYKAGYDDGYNGQPGRYGEVYSRRPDDNNWQPDRDDEYSTRQFGGTDVAFDAGYRDGVTLGEQDQTRRTHGDYRQSLAYRKGDYGYRASYGDRAEYQQRFRDGFDRGYQDAYGRSRYLDDSAYPYSSAVNGGSLDPRGPQGSDAGSVAITVPGNRQWTATNIQVQAGDVVRFQSSGEISFTNANDRAGVAGSPDLKYVAGAPIPGALAGALIGRIGNGQPFGIGDQTTIRMPGSGTLYLGINDDNVGDNSGQFQIVISR